MNERFVMSTEIFLQNRLQTLSFFSLIQASWDALWLIWKSTIHWFNGFGFFFSHDSIQLIKLHFYSQVHCKHACMKPQKTRAKIFLVMFCQYWSKFFFSHIFMSWTLKRETRTWPVFTGENMFSAVSQISTIN